MFACDVDAELGLGSMWGHQAAGRWPDFGSARCDMREVGISVPGRSSSVNQL